MMKTDIAIMKKRLKIYNKLHNNSGMTLLELLCAILILLLVTGVMTALISMGVEQYNKSMRNSQSQVLYSTLMTVISDELTYSTQIKTDDLGNVRQFLSKSYGIRGNLSTIMTDKSGLNGYGKIIFGNCDNPEEYLHILGKGSYPNGLTARVDSLTYYNDSSTFTVKLSIGYEGKEIHVGTFNVLNVNKTKAEILT